MLRGVKGGFSGGSKRDMTISKGDEKLVKFLPVGNKTDAERFSPILKYAMAKKLFIILDNDNQNPAEIKQNLIAQLTSPVRWTQCVQQMIADGATDFIEVGPGKVLQGLVKKIDRSAETFGARLNIEA